MSPPIVVIGNGVAGVCAALAAKERGHEVLVLCSAAGSSSMMSGALDEIPWDNANSQTEASDCTDIQGFLGAFPLFSITHESVRLLTQQGISRPARGRDRSLLDLSALPNGSQIALPRIARKGWDADLLAKSFNHDAWARAKSLSFHAVEISDLTDDRLRHYPDSDLAREFDSDAYFRAISSKLSTLSSNFGAVLLGPWLGILKNRSEELANTLKCPVGECASIIGGTAGLRFDQHRSAALAASGIESRRFRVRAVEANSSSVLIRGDSDDLIKASSVVIATGGLISGGVCYSPAEWALGSEIPERAHPPLSMGFVCDGDLRFNGRSAEIPGSLYGLNLEELTWPKAQQEVWQLDRVGLRNINGRVLNSNGDKLDRIFVCGDAADGSRHTAIDAIRTGWCAGISAVAS